MKIWSSFTACDLNNNGVLDLYELKVLFWLFDTRKPSKERVERERKMMDDDNNGVISKIEWLNYFCSTCTDYLENQIEYYDYGLRVLFEEVDKTKTGQLTLDEIRDLIKKDMKNLLSQVPKDKQYALEEDFRHCAHQVFVALMGRQPQGKTDAIDWLIMKNYKHICRGLIKSQEARIKSFVA